jgi:hypothetical protein
MRSFGCFLLKVRLGREANVLREFTGVLSIGRVPPR